MAWQHGSGNIYEYRSLRRCCHPHRTIQYTLDTGAAIPTLLPICEYVLNRTVADATKSATGGARAYDLWRATIEVSPLSNPESGTQSKDDLSRSRRTRLFGERTLTPPSFRCDTDAGTAVNNDVFSSACVDGCRHTAVQIGGFAIGRLMEKRLKGLPAAVFQRALSMRRPH